MEMKAVDSSTISAIGYDPASKTMRIAFTRGMAYNYMDVPAEMHAALMAAPFKGTHFHKVLRNNTDIKVAKHVEPTVDLH